MKKLRLPKLLLYMLNYKTFFLLLFCIATFYGCDPAKPIVGNYYLIAVDNHEAQNISYKVDEDVYVGVVPAYVYEAQHNGKYIIAKQHPRSPLFGFDKKGNPQVYPEGGKINTDSVQYYIIDISKETRLFPEKAVIGPLDSLTFLQEKHKLNIDAHFDEK